jgi:ATP-dependent Clp protease ATP-binding subunit ClpC
MLRGAFVSLSNLFWRPRPDDAIDLARLEASRARKEYVGTESLLLALASLKERPLGRALASCGLSGDRIRNEIDRLLASPPAHSKVQFQIGRLPLTPRVKRAVEHALVTAQAQGASWFQPEHLLLALLEDSESVAFQMVANVCSVDTLRQALAQEGRWTEPMAGK